MRLTEAAGPQRTPVRDVRAAREALATLFVLAGREETFTEALELSRLLAEAIADAAVVAPELAQALSKIADTGADAM